MPNTIFVALQCCQCSMMQVKQQKKSSNKWTCVMCNQKQSVRKVFAQGNMARDLRPLVQSFNMSLESQKETETVDVEPQSDQDRHHWRNPQIDWTEYLDKVEDKEERDGEGEHSGTMRIITEMPNKKHKSNKYSSRNSETTDGGENLVRDKEPRKWRQRKAKQWSAYMAQEEEVFRTCQPTDDKEMETQFQTTQNSASKWSIYMVSDDDQCQPVTMGKPADHTDEWSNDARDKIVEDDVHPDFI